MGNETWEWLLGLADFDMLGTLGPPKFGGPHPEPLHLFVLIFPGRARYIMANEL